MHLFTPWGKDGVLCFYTPPSGSNMTLRSTLSAQLPLELHTYKFRCLILQRNKMQQIWTGPSFCPTCAPPALCSGQFDSRTCLFPMGTWSHLGHQLCFTCAKSVTRWFWPYFWFPQLFPSLPECCVTSHLDCCDGFINGILMTSCHSQIFTAIRIFYLKTSVGFLWPPLQASCPQVSPCSVPRPLSSHFFRSSSTNFLQLPPKLFPPPGRPFLELLLTLEDSGKASPSPGTPTPSALSRLPATRGRKANFHITVLSTRCGTTTCLYLLPSTRPQASEGRETYFTRLCNYSAPSILHSTLPTKVLNPIQSHAI